MNDTFEREVCRHRAAIFGAALRLTRSPDEAEDLAQEAILRAHDAYGRFEGQAFRAWVLRIVHNLHINRHNAGKRRPRSEGYDDGSEAADDSPSVLLALIEGQLAPEILDALAGLPRPFARAVAMVDLGELSYGEAADAEGVPVGTIRSRLARGRKALRLALHDFALDEGYLRKEP